MPRKKVDNRIRILVENGIITRQRSMFVIVGDKGRDQVVLLHHMLCKASVKTRPSVLWCYRKELGFSTHRKKRMKQLKKKLRSGGADVDEDNPFELFVSATNIRYCYYSETHKILGNTYGMCVLQDFEALTPNLVARTVETVEGGGVVAILVKTVTSLKQLYTMTMDVHSRYRTEAHDDVVGRFNERFFLSLADCSNCLVMDDQLNILPISSHMLSIEPVPQQTMESSKTSEQIELEVLKESLVDTQPVGSLVGCTRTLDQGKALLKFIEAISEKTLCSTVAMTASRGRGKSAALGLAIAGAIAFSYSNIFVTSPSPENLKTLFEFLLRGFDALGYTEHEDYEVIQSTNPEFNRAIVRVNIFHEHRQTVHYIHPSDSHKLEQAELVCIDEAAAIPLPLVKKLLGPYLVFLASTVNGYEGTGRSLSLKLLDQLRKQSQLGGRYTSTGSTSAKPGRVLREVSLSEPIRYATGDPVEKWLHGLLCLDAVNIPRLVSGCPPPQDCELYYVNRDTLFSYHKASESFLHRVMALYVASHYKNTPNDLQLLSDAPAHHIFVLVPPVTAEQTSLPDVLCVVQVCLEGEISKSSIMKSLSRGKRGAGDLIPWTISQQFVDQDFPSLSGARIVRIATHPDLQGMGYGTRTLQLLCDYYLGRIPNLSEDPQPMETTAIHEINNDEDLLLTEELTPRSKLPPLLMKLSERPPESLEYLGVSYGLTPPLLKFWKRAGYRPIYLRQTSNELTGEHSCIMIKPLSEEDCDWLDAYYKDFKKRFLSLLSYQFAAFSPQLSLQLVHESHTGSSPLTVEELRSCYNPYDLKRLELYSRNMADHHLITDLLPSLANLYFTNKCPFSVSAVQSAILLGMGLQHKSVEKLEVELDLPSSQIMGLFNRIIRKFVKFFTSIQEEDIGREIPLHPSAKGGGMEPVKEDLEVELTQAAKEISKKQFEKSSELEKIDLSQYAILGEEKEWENALSSGKQTGIVSVKRAAKRKRSDPESGKEKKKKSNKDRHKHT